MKIYHLTDYRNIPSIKAHGLLPSALQSKRSFRLTTFWSWRLDSIKGDDQAVFFFVDLQHPMVYALASRALNHHLVLVQTSLELIRSLRKTFRPGEILVWGVVPPDVLTFTKLSK
jgi:hypothetical protein